ncbi:MAG: ferritin [Deltaproteobacteria bacterium]|nr:ferritin [Deltaproteobacteria bacterium]TLN01139.1 MAG: ferritin [bacterium]
MGKEYSLQEALKLAIKAEKDSMDFYLKAASVSVVERAKKIFQLLAGEEEEHLRAFFGHYKGSDFGDLASYISSPPDKASANYALLEKAIDRETHEQQALEIALKEEKYLIDRYSQFAGDMVDPLVRGVFEKVIWETQKHYDLIEAEYSYVMGMVHESDQDIYVRE